MSKIKGFTLTEVIIVLVIIGIISVFAVPRLYDHYHNIKILAAAKQIMADIRYAQTIAMNEHDSSWVEFDDVSNLYKIYSGINRTTRALVKDPFEQQDFIKYLDQGQYKNVVITGLNIGSDKNIAFDWFGNTSNSGEIILNNSTTISVENVTGMVQIVGW